MLTKITTPLVAGLCSLIFTSTALPCTRAVYQGPDELVITGRSMDWKDDIPANLWLFPRGIERHGAVGPNSITWTSKYGSVVASAFDIASADGMNEKGLVANLLWLAESQYPEFGPEQTGLSVAAWVQYVLDNFATVEQAVAALRTEPFVVVSSEIPGTHKFATLHLSISDATGDNAIFEYIEGELRIHHDRSFTVMTNSPIFEQQLALNAYWQQIGGLTMLPGTNRAADRFVRASFYLNAIPHTNDPRIATASVLSLMRNVSVPFGISSEEEPNISSTRWRSVSDHKNLRYFFETVLTPNTFWIELTEVDFSPGAPVKKLRLDHHRTFAGNALEHFQIAQPFEFAGL